MKKNLKKIIRRYVGELPLIMSIIEKIGLRNILDGFFSKESRNGISSTDILILLILNLTIGKKPLYELDKWVNALDVRCLAMSEDDLNISDDRFGRVLDKLFATDRASLMTAIVINMVNKFNIDLSELHNDSTTVKAYGEYNARTETGFELKRGKSKDFRPDLKQLVYSLTISKDGSVPVHFKAYPGNTTDETTHIETWNTLCSIRRDPNFLYVADCKVCTDKQLNYIKENGGRVVTLIPDKWKETKHFKTTLRNCVIEKREIWRRVNGDDIDYFYVFDGDYFTNKRDYRIFWIHSSSKCEQDRLAREERMKKAERMLQKMVLRLNKRKLKSKEAIENECEAILKKHKVSNFFKIDIGESREEHLVRKKDRPDKHSRAKTIIKSIYTLSWSRNKEVLDKEKRIDGIFPLLSTDKNLSAKEALEAYKYQPKLEKRFTQFKSVHNAAPLFCKKIERIEANMFVFFIALLIQSLIEREIRQQMKKGKIISLPVYPEDREATHPTTAKIFDIFSQISSYKLINGDGDEEEYKDDLNETQQNILTFLNIREDLYWNSIRPSQKFL